MSYVIAAPEHVAAAASDLANIGSTISQANVAAVAPTSSVLAPAADEVSANIVALFGAHAQAYQALSGQAALFHQQFVQLMNGGAAEYAAAEAGNASPLQTAGQGAMSGISAPSQAAAQVPASGASGAPAAVVSGGNGAASQLMSGGGAPAAATGGGGGLFGTGGAGFTGSLSAGENLGARVAGAGGGPVEAAESAEELDVAPPAAMPDSAVTPLASVPAAGPVYSPATARPPASTPGYPPAAGGPAESPDE